MVNIIDITLMISPQMATYLDDPAPEFTPFEDPGSENGFKTTRINILTHCGTHVDPPAHLLRKGLSVDEIPLDRLVGPAVIVDVRQEHQRSLNYFKTLELPTYHIFLFQTGESEYLRKGVFRPNYWAPNGAISHWLLKFQPRAIGIDTLSIDRGGIEEVEAHPIFLEAGIPIIEGLDLSAVVPGTYFLVCLPLKLWKGDGAPARAILLQELK